MSHVSTIVRTLEGDARTWEGTGDYFDETMEMASTGTYYNNNSNTTIADPQHNPASITDEGVEAKQQKLSDTKENPNLGERDKSKIVPF
eukprot:8360947-Ditylum_brightwellii.AAC.1